MLVLAIKEVLICLVFRLVIQKLEYIHNKKDISISVEWMEGVIVKSPEGIEMVQLQQIIRKKAPWIVEKLKKQMKFPCQVKLKNM
jgi:predicted metal-dependent hydrolase